MPQITDNWSLAAVGVGLSAACHRRGLFSGHYSDIDDNFIINLDQLGLLGHCLVKEAQAEDADPIVTPCRMICLLCLDRIGESKLRVRISAFFASTLKVT